jgi:lactoylglutathione lyase
MGEADMFNKISAAVIFVKDFARCEAFYRETLGLQVVDRNPGFVAFKMADQDFALSELSDAAQWISEDAILPDKDGVCRVLLCAVIDNVDAAYADLKAKGVNCIRPPEDQHYGLRTAYFADPEGNIWQIGHKIPKQVKAAAP